MARARYQCKCGRTWEGATPQTVRFATGQPVYCQCGQLAYFKESIMITIEAVSPKTAAEIVKHEADWAEDPYHQNILMAAKALEGSSDWEYRTQLEGGSTHWYNTREKFRARVCWDQEKGWEVSYGDGGATPA